ncbi:hypothetical protein F7R91_17295 [Streptomyces luteolifulvus]|uniref:Uncharacterized protein n=1 Tax=Streptomyces luteolifulvus TaxID=2615112 RepID=A0A6H9UYU8_9ACTN|nr:hypothetical protein F7R91_17295 [Streptomyces luteolifulvus]
MNSGWRTRQRPRRSRTSRPPAAGSPSVAGRDAGPRPGIHADSPAWIRWFGRLDGEGPSPTEPGELGELGELGATRVTFGQDSHAFHVDSWLSTHFFAAC